jgi:hypothetical protein
MGAIGTRKTKVVGTFVGGERTFWKSFQKMAVCSHACKENKTQWQNFGKENKSWRVSGSKRV